jgi:hypothetical protein
MLNPSSVSIRRFQIKADACDLRSLGNAESRRDGASLRLLNSNQDVRRSTPGWAEARIPHHWRAYFFEAVACPVGKIDAISVRKLQVF